MRLLAAVFGLAALAWAAIVLPQVWGAASAESLARRFIGGDSFREEAMTEAITTATAAARWPLPAAQRAEAVLRLSLAERALARTDVAASDARLAQTATAVDAALTLAPADAYLWLLRYWLAETRDGFNPAQLKDLAASYELGPREGWIAIRRNALALRRFTRLDDAAQQRVVAEFAGMVASELVAEAGRNLAGPGWPIRERLLAGLADVDLVPKQALVKLLRNDGVRIEVPGMPEREERPWR
jgi:hypothetical protein